jgi:AcrR family transcriptional regulator
VAGGVDLLNRVGAEGLSLAELAARFRVRTPSLYNHVDGLDGLRRDLALKGLQDLISAVQTATTGLSGREALLAAAGAYRDFAHTNPGLFQFTLRPVEADDKDLAAANQALQQLIVAALRGYHLNAETAQAGAVAVRSALSGFSMLETAGSLASVEDLDARFAAMLDLLDRGLTQVAM